MGKRLTIGLGEGREGALAGSPVPVQIIPQIATVMVALRAGGFRMVGRL